MRIRDIKTRRKIFPNAIHLFILKSSETDIQLIQLYSMLLHKIFEEYDARAPLSKVSKI